MGAIGFYSDVLSVGYLLYLEKQAEHMQQCAPHTNEKEKWTSKIEAKKAQFQFK